MSMRLVFWTSVGSFILVMAVLLLGNVLSGAGVSDEAITENIFLRVAGGTFNLIWFVTAVILFIYAIKKLIAYWHSRSMLTNIVLTIVLLFFNFFAGYYFYLRKEEEES